MKEREERIRDTILSVEKKVSKTAKESEKLKNEYVELASRKDQILKDSQNEAEKIKAHLLEEARNDIESRKKRWQIAQQKEWEEFHSEFRLKVQEEALEITRQIFLQLTDSDLEERVVRLFIKKIELLKSTSEQAVFPENMAVIVRSALLLTDKQQTLVKEAIEKSIGFFSNIQFEVRTGFISGIELIVNNRKLVWTFEGIIDAFENDIIKFVGNKKINHAHKI